MFVTIRPEDFAAADALGAVLDRCGAPIASVRDHLGAEHAGLLALAFDVGVLPPAASLRATRDIGPVQRALADLETLGLVRVTPHGLTLPDVIINTLTDALRAHWDAQVLAAGQALDAAPAQVPKTTPDALVWLRRLLVFATHRGLRRTDTCALHQSDIRRYEATCELPSRRLLETCAGLGLGLDVFSDLGGKLIVGPGIDVVDLPNDGFVAECDHAWAGGRIDLALEETTAAAGVLGHWPAPIVAQAGAEGGRATSLYGAGMRLGAAVPRMFGSVSPDPASSVLAGSKFDLRGVPAAVEAFHARARKAVLAALDELPRQRALALGDVERLVGARLARLALDHPIEVPRKTTAPPARVFAAALAALPWHGERVREALPTLVWALRCVHGAAELTPERLVLGGAHTPAATAGRLTVQPNGDVVVPPDASVHALVHLSCGARPSKLDTVSTFTLDRRALMRLADAGMDVTQWGQLLEQWTGVALPGTVAELLGDVARRHGELTVVPAGAVLVADDPVRMAELLAYPKVARAVLMRASDTVVVLGPGVDLTALLEDLGDRGFSAIVTDAPLTPES